MAKLQWIELCMQLIGFTQVHQAFESLQRLLWIWNVNMGQWAELCIQSCWWWAKMEWKGEKREIEIMLLNIEAYSEFGILYYVFICAFFKCQK